MFPQADERTKFWLSTLLDQTTTSYYFAHYDLHLSYFPTGVQNEVLSLGLNETAFFSAITS